MMLPRMVWVQPCYKNGQPVAYASRALTDCETRYAQIEKECLAILFVCERFDFYLYGRQRSRLKQTTCRLNPFSKIVGSGSSPSSKKRLRLQRYSLKVTYKRGTQMYIADTLSRAVACSNSAEQFEVQRVQAMTRA